MFIQKATLKERRKAGLTLIELLLVISLIGVFLAFLLSGLSFNKGQARVKALETAQWLTIVASAEREYKIDHGDYYSNGDDDVAEFLKNSGYLSADVIEYKVKYAERVINSKQCKTLLLLDSTIGELGAESFCIHFCRTLKNKGVIGSQLCDLNLNVCNNIKNDDEVGIILECS